MHDNVEVWGELPKVTLVAESVQVRPAGVEGLTERLTVPVKPLIAFSVIVEVPVEPVGMGDGVTGPAEMVKSVGTTAGMVMVIW